LSGVFCLQENKTYGGITVNIKDAIIKRVYNIKERLYIEAKYLADFGFGIGQPIKYNIEQDSKTITVIPAETGADRRVAKTTQKSGKTVPVIDIKADEVKAFFAKHNQVQVEIHKGKIIFTVVGVAKSAENVISFEDAKHEKLIRTQTRYAVSVGEFAKASGIGQLDLFDLFRDYQNDSNHTSERELPPILKEKAIRMLSLFSGCGSLDKGFLDEGFNIIFANDRWEPKTLKKTHIETYRHNIGDHIIMQDVMEFTEDDIPETDVLVAGIPCVRFSALNTLHNFRDDESDTHPLVEQTLNIIKWSKAKAFVFENVTNFLTVKGGIMLKRLQERLPEFHIVSAIVDATSLGSAQKRRRAVVIGLKGATPSIVLPHLTEVNTVKDVFANIEGANQQDLGFLPTAKTLERMLHVPPGGNVNNVPLHLRAPNKKFSNYLVRLDPDGFSPTITHVQDEAFTHPYENRYLTVRETARLFSLPDDFTFVGSLTAIFEMLKNAVDYKVARFMAKTVKKQLMPLLQ
jgi:DNA-cytosine methyltransferase